jgi:hypothetical protein
MLWAIAGFAAGYVSAIGFDAAKAKAVAAWSRVKGFWS